ncbi:glycosyltransferase family 2 protein [Maridesulfovibrio hydrothermalis]|uniref:Putative glycosyltransferase n=1 Tax=Maridesulfovibrio hydrothermalis AM13 = DSM 14728 TaxID=1121451 RepID=L0RAJ8_9BACT|nr:glycosyltransferase family 2 protein [Maridesulfovibrio hydrothermalis]CCO22591.1 putative glycosyltransferase [Maridesulfovibrio hydrothermalis AM13 = DSM 14728]
MVEHSIQNLQQLYEKQQDLAEKIKKLQLTVLPHVRFIMLLERAEELNNSMNLGLQSLGNHEVLEETRAAIENIYKLISTVHQKNGAELNAIQKLVNYNQFPAELVKFKKELREHAASLAEALAQNQENIIANFASPLITIESKLEQLAVKVRKAIVLADPPFFAGCKTMDKIFSLLEKTPQLAEINIYIQKHLNKKTYECIKNSRLFDEYFYRNQVNDAAKTAPDSLLHYLTEGEKYSPNPFFNATYYLADYEEVGMLRYHPFEHFICYGEILCYNPGPDFDALYYLENNGDVLEAGIPPFQHFLLHGLTEGRQPSAKAGAFFVKRYLQHSPVNLAFIGSPDKLVKEGWDMLISLCRNREGGQVRLIAPEDWSGNESKIDAIVVSSEGAALLQEELLNRLSKNKVRLLYLGTTPGDDLKSLLQKDIFSLENVCAVCPDYKTFLCWQESEIPLKLRYYSFNDPDNATPFLDALLDSLGTCKNFSLRRTGLWKTPSESKPYISVVSIIYKKSKEMIRFLESLNRQDLARNYELILVDDASPDDSVERIEEWLKEKRQNGLMNRFMDVRILRNESNRGNCSSRNRGVDAARADIVLVADGDVVLSTSSLSEHLWAYRFDDCDAVIGFFRFNLDYSFVFHWLAACEVNSDIIRQHLKRSSEFAMERLNMNSLPNSVFTFVTRNTSFRKSAFKEEYFDETFNYSSDRNSGYGEEDHEIAAKLYSDNKNIRFLESSICVHMRHEDNSHNTDKALANLRNWNKLIKKHPDLRLIDRQYYQWRTCDLLHKTSGKPDALEVKVAKEFFNASDRVNVSIPRSRPIKILSWNCNIPYQYDLLKMHHQFTMVVDKANGGWDYSLRPRPYNVDFIPPEKVAPEKYDLALIPFDKRVLFPGKHRERFQRMLELSSGLPTIALCHELPYGYVQNGINTEECELEEQRKYVRFKLRDAHVVCCSHIVQNEWKFKQSSVIWHGFSPQEYPAGKNDLGCLTFSNDYLANIPDVDACKMLREIKQRLPESCTVEEMKEPFPHAGYETGSQEWSVAKFQKYGHYIGQFIVQLTPFNNLAMPRLRAEAMLAGCIPVTVRSYDVDMFIKNGVNGFAGESAEEIGEYLNWLLSNGKDIQKISRNARLTAMDIFNVDRLISKWERLIIGLT